MEIEQPKVKKIMTLGGGKAEIYAAKIPEGAKRAGVTIKEIAQKKNSPSECLFIGLYKEEKGEFLIPRGSHVVDEGDMVFLLSRSQFIKRVTDFLTKI